jgi:hypothetical protein
MCAVLPSKACTACCLQGGPDRLSRHDMAMAVAQQCGLDSKAALEAKSADVKRCACQGFGCKAPPNGVGVP